MESQRYFGEEGFKQLVKHIKDLSSEVSQIPQVDASAYSSIFKLVCNGFRPIASDSSILESTWVSSDAVMNKFLENVKLGDTVILYGTTGPTIMHVTLVENTQVVLQGSSNSFNGNEMTILGVLGPREQDRQLYGWERPLVLSALQDDIDNGFQSLGSRVATLEGEMTTVQEDVSDLKEDVEALQKALDELDVIDPVYPIKLYILGEGRNGEPVGAELVEGEEDVLNSLFIILQQNPHAHVEFEIEELINIKRSIDDEQPDIAVWHVDVTTKDISRQVIYLYAYGKAAEYVVGFSPNETPYVSVQAMASKQDLYSLVAKEEMAPIEDETIIDMVNSKIITR